MLRATMHLELGNFGTLGVITNLIVEGGAKVNFGAL